MIAQSALESDLYRGVDSATYRTCQEGARAFVNAYRKFAAQVTTATGGRATSIDAGCELLYSTLLGGYTAQSLVGTASALARGLMAFWQMQPWTGGVGPGQTTAPGHPATEPALQALFQGGIAWNNARVHAQQLALICATGARVVVVTEYPPGSSPQTAPVI